ncbi:OmpP1/FadL family transporter [Gaetbulibacter saemankumensis]|uniref:OmpP1/FadL family transporter n=1 Tax=Gaetbulibacter saemankumensis TaxID=311208 RepID=UPI0003F801C7|nr:outer membrane protein transport protein [Gaetbulibacter saemankumensis]
MKKLNLFFIGILSVSFVYAQDLTDAIRYSEDEIQGTARFRAMSGAFGALGGDMSAVSLNPAGSAVFAQSHASFTLSNMDIKNKTHYFNGLTNSKENDFDLNQGGASFVFASRSNSPWKKFSVGIAYEKTNSHDNYWRAIGLNNLNDPSYSNSIASYFYDYADGKRLDEISALPEETLSEAYREIGRIYGYGHQQGFLGFESFILEPDDINNDGNTTYFSNINPGSFDHDYSYITRGYNGKITFNMAAQYEESVYLGLNLNTHFIDYNRTTLLFEYNDNPGSLVNDVEFENNLTAYGNGFSFQLGGIFKLGPGLRLGVTYDSPTWYTIEERTSQYLATDGDAGFIEIYPEITNIYPRYRLKTPSKLKGSLAYVFGTHGLISFDYSRKDYSNTKFKPGYDFTELNDDVNNFLAATNSYRVGGEYKIERLSLRGGYRFEESPYNDNITLGDLNGYSFGLGYNFGNVKLDVTYDYFERSEINNLYNLYYDTPPSASTDHKNNRVSLSLCFNI